MKLHASKNGGETGWTRTPACRPLGHIISQVSMGAARFYVTTNAADVTCAKCRTILEGREMTQNNATVNMCACGECDACRWEDGYAGGLNYAARHPGVSGAVLGAMFLRGDYPGTAYESGFHAAIAELAAGEDAR